VLMSLKNISLKTLIYISTGIMAFFLVFLVGMYFYIFSLELEGQVQASFESLADSIETRLLECVESINESAKQYAYSGDIQTVTFFNDPEEYFIAAGPAEDVVNFILNSNPNISAICVYNYNGRIFSSDSSKRWIFNQAMEEHGIDKGVTISTPFFSTLFYDNGLKSTPYVIYFYPFYNVREGKFERNESAICVILCDVNHLINWLDIDKSTRSAMAILYENSIVSSNRKLNEIEIGALRNIENGRGKVTVGKEKYLSNSVTLPQFGWNLIYMVPEKDLLGGIIRVRNISYALLSIVMVLNFVMMMQIIKFITRPIQQIVNDVRSVRKGESSRIRIANLLELQELSNGINQTLESIEQAHAKEREAQSKLYHAIIEQKQALIYAYRSQINPHFLFNTLECMRSMARHYNTKPLEKIISSLSAMFRYSLRSSVVVTLSEEIEHLKNYIGFMRLRTNGSFELRMFVPAETFSHPILAMCLQPIVENSITHGFINKGKDESRIIQLQSWISNASGTSTLHVRISDNGCGISEEKLNQLKSNIESENNMEKKHSIGLYNIAKRLKLVFGEQSRLTIKSRYRYYTSVELTVPKQPRDTSLNECEVV